MRKEEGSLKAQSLNQGNELCIGEELDADIDPEVKASFDLGLDINGGCDYGLGKNTQVDDQLGDADIERGLDLGLDIGLNPENESFDIL